MLLVLTENNGLKIIMREEIITRLPPMSKTSTKMPKIITINAETIVFNCEVAERVEARISLG